MTPEENQKKDFLAFTAFLLSRGVPHAAQVLKDQCDGNVLFYVEDIDRLNDMASSDIHFRRSADNFMTHIKHLLVHEENERKKKALIKLFDTISNTGAGNMPSISLN